MGFAGLAGAFVAALLIPFSVGRTEANCTGTTDDREIVGFIPDIVLTAGVPENRTIRHRHVLRREYATANGPLPPFNECGALARSNVEGLSVRSTYFDFGVLHSRGEWAGLNGAHGTEGATVVLPPIDLELVFNGGAPAGTVGTVEIAHRMGGETSFIPRLIAAVNVYVVAQRAPLPPTWFTAVADAASASGARLVLDHPLLNGAPNRPIFVSHVASPVVAAWPHPVSVAYDPALSRWTIRNDDAIPMPPSIAFNVRIDPSARVLSQPRRVPGRLRTRLRIDDPRANYNRYATIFVTAASPNPHPIAVCYEAPHWYIVNADGARMRHFQRFHVQVFGATAYRDDGFRGLFRFNPLGTNKYSNGAGIDLHGIGPKRNAGSNRYLDFSWAAGARLPMIITPNQTPTGRDRVVDAAYFSLWFTGTGTPADRWAVAHADGASMPNASSFNVWAPPPIGRPNLDVRPPLTPRVP